jgi:hypothetical protein
MPNVLFVACCLIEKGCRSSLSAPGMLVLTAIDAQHRMALIVGLCMSLAVAGYLLA